MSLLWVIAVGLPSGVLARDIPLHPAEHGVAEDDHPHTHFRNDPDRLWSLHHEPLADHLPSGKRCVGGTHGAHCYSADRYDKAGVCGDVSEPDDEDPDENGHSYDERYIHRMTTDIKAGGSLPALVYQAGGGHRLAAMNDADMTHVHIWRPDDGKAAW